MPIWMHRVRWNVARDRTGRIVYTVPVQFRELAYKPSELVASACILYGLFRHVGLDICQLYTYIRKDGRRLHICAVVVFLVVCIFLFRPVRTTMLPCRQDHQPSEDISVGFTRCPLCGDQYRQPNVLACFHTFCKPCLEKLVDSPGRIICPQCHAETQLCADQGVESLLTDYALANIQQEQESQLANGDHSEEENRETGSTDVSLAKPNCTGCKSKDGSAVAHCYDCSNFLCENCVMAHKFMHCFEGHRVVDMDEVDLATVDLRPVKCLQHKQEPLKFFCFSCNIPICKECTMTEHARGVHTFESISEVSEQQLEFMRGLLEDARSKQRSLASVFKGVDSAGQRLSEALRKAQQDINDTVGSLVQAIDEQRQRALRDLENAYNTKQAALAVMDGKLQQTMEKLTHTIEFTSRLLKYANPTEVLVFKKLLETRLQAILHYNPDLSVVNQYELEFIPNTEACRLAVSNTFGYIRQSGDLPVLIKTSVQPISRPTHGASSTTGPSPPAGILSSSLPPSLSMCPTLGPPTHFVNHHLSPSSGLLNGGPAAHAFSDSDLFTTAAPSLEQFVISDGACGESSYNYEKWSSASSDMFGGPGAMAMNSMGGSSFYALGAGDTAAGQQQMDLQSIPPVFYQSKSQMKRQKMIYHCKLGEFGVAEGQFTEPSGVAVNAQNDIMVADTNNHRIQIFDKEGRYKFHFGECGKRDGQLLYPNRVAVNRVTGDVIVTERSPTHQIQVYNQYGQFLRKFGASVLQHPRGVTVDDKGRIVVVECKVMRVLIFDMFGNVLQKFGCSKYLEFPNGVVTNDKQEIFISDNRAHCVKVFNYEGVYLRQIGGEGLTNFPIGVGINQSNELVVADNHNNFNLTIFQQDGTLVSAFESKVKHAQCFDMALLEDGSVVLASKDYRLYIYRYQLSSALPL